MRFGLDEPQRDQADAYGDADDASGDAGERHRAGQPTSTQREQRAHGQHEHYSAERQRNREQQRSADTRGGGLLCAGVAGQQRGQQRERARREERRDACGRGQRQEPGAGRRGQVEPRVHDVAGVAADREDDHADRQQ
jgi:hypothetical protein